MQAVVRGTIVRRTLCRSTGDTAPRVAIQKVLHLQEKPLENMHGSAIAAVLVVQGSRPGTSGNARSAIQQAPREET